MAIDEAMLNATIGNAPNENNGIVHLPNNDDNLQVSLIEMDNSYIRNA